MDMERDGRRLAGFPQHLSSRTGFVDGAFSERGLGGAFSFFAFLALAGFCTGVGDKIVVTAVPRLSP